MNDRYEGRVVRLRSSLRRILISLQLPQGLARHGIEGVETHSQRMKTSLRMERISTAQYDRAVIAESPTSLVRRRRRGGTAVNDPRFERDAEFDEIDDAAIPGRRIAFVGTAAARVQFQWVHPPKLSQFQLRSFVELPLPRPLRAMMTVFPYPPRRHRRRRRRDVRRDDVQGYATVRPDGHDTGEGSTFRECHRDGHAVVLVVRVCVEFDANIALGGAI